MKWTQLIYIQLFIPKKQKYTFFSNAYGTFSKTDHIIGHKRLKKFRILKSYQAFSLTTRD